MSELVHNIFKDIVKGEERTALQQLISTLADTGKRYFLRNEILEIFANYCHQSQRPAYFYHSSPLGTLIQYTHEIILEGESSWFVVRPRIASQEVWRLSADFTTFELRTPKELLDVCDRLVNRYQPQILEIDLQPFYPQHPRVSDSRNIGQGLTFLNNYLCHQFQINPQYWLDVLFKALNHLKYNGIDLLINQRINSGTKLAKQIKQILEFLTNQPPQTPYSKIRFQLQELGLEPGWGNNVTRIQETLQLLQRLIETPQPSILEAFVSRISAVFRVVLISIHGWVGQQDVIGRDETLGQVNYVLEQARSLENKLQEEIKLAGLDILNIQPQVIILTRLIPYCEGTFCNLRLEKVNGTENAWILRVPFRGNEPEITNNWISKFEMWPYLEQFTLDAEKELLAEFKGKPDLIIGNYSDGNLVASLMSRHLKVTQCNIAHALEKPKYLFSNLYWQNLEDKYHFSAQFTADIISMNAADFIITSSYQEIVGTPETIGQYESYKFFTMPQLYHVVDGIDLFSSKFNMVAPGVSETTFFPYFQTLDRDPKLSQSIQDLLLTRQNEEIIGYLSQPEKTPIFSASPITSIKNLTGLAECFGKNQELQARCNLILLSSRFHSDGEEAEEIEKLHQIIHQYNLEGKIRWIGKRLSIREMGETYRIIGDLRGIYIHFARFEAFGRTILEAMISGLPTFVTQFGGASEILADRENEFYINPMNLEGTAEKIINFLDQCATNSSHWSDISQLMIERIKYKYNWNLYTSHLLVLAKVFSFWNFISPEDNEARDRYMETLFHLVYKPRAETIKK
ncbi:MAG TPA: sucrose synthase [Nostocaceae cyanobacterium]|nr:sucrose synthase [Nostocaceae cyanobacterium]